MNREVDDARRWRPGGRAWSLLAIGACALLSARGLGLDLAGLVPREAGLNVARDLLRAALSPALDYQTDVVEGTPAFARRVAGALAQTVLFAAAAMSLALPAGLALGLFASDAFWARRAPDGGERVSAAGRTAQVALRVLISSLRAVHELLWAVVFLAALGLNAAAAVVAIAIPFAGTLAKVASEMLDEAPRGSWRALGAAGAPSTAALLVGLVPRALPDVLGYAFYRFECALRSAAVLGFFGYPTIGLYIAQSFENAQFREVWSYLYALIALVVAVEAWSGAVRRRLVG